MFNTRWDIPGAFVRTTQSFYTEFTIISTYKLLHFEYSILKFKNHLKGFVLFSRIMRQYAY